MKLCWGFAEMADLSKVGERLKLKPRPGNEPHWHRIQVGCSVGYRPSLKDKHGRWSARAYDEDLRKYKVKQLGDFGELEGSQRFAAAKVETELFWQLVRDGGELRPSMRTVADACRDYVEKLETPEKSAEAKQRFNRYVYGQPVAKVKLDKLRKKHVQQWRDWLTSQPAQVSRSKKGKVRTRARAASTINRDMAVLRAALSKVLPKGAPSTPAAWQEALTSIRGANGNRRIYLDKSQRQALLRHIPSEAEPFARALCLLPVRPGALAALSVENFNCLTKELHIVKDKAGAGRRIQISSDAAELLSGLTQDKLPAAPLFMRKDGSRWNRHTWHRPFSIAASLANLPEGATAYTLRHCVITDLITARLPILTVAQLSGTSVEMIEKHYGHLSNEAAVDALATLRL